MARLKDTLTSAGPLKTLIGLLLVALLVGFTAGAIGTTKVGILATAPDSISAFSLRSRKADIAIDSLRVWRAQRDSIWAVTVDQINDIYCATFPARCDPRIRP